MFGFVVADSASLSEAQRQRYRGCYCGLCRTLQQRHGELSRLTLNYDMTFLVILLTGMYEPEECSGEDRCIVHPLHRRSWWCSRFTDYAADMTVALAYHNCMDDWADDRKLLSLAEAKLLRTGYEKVQAAWPRQCGAIECCMAELAEIERSGEVVPDAAANSFGRLMGALFDCTEDSVWSPHFRAFGEALGRFIYLMDACIDLEKDRKKGSYNPLAAKYGMDMPEEEKLMLLKLLIGECAAEFEQLPIVQDADILRSVLYSGVWTQYALKMKKRKGDAGDDQRSV